MVNAIIYPVPKSSLSEANFFRTLEQSMLDKREAIRELFHLLCLPDIPYLEKVYQHLFKLFPHFTDNEFEELKNILPKFLERNPSLMEEQRLLALKLADRQCKIPSHSAELRLLSYHLAMDFYAQAIQISEACKNSLLIQEAHQFATILLIRAYLESGLFEDELKSAKSLGDLKKCEAIISRIEAMKTLCCRFEDQEIIQKFYNQARNVLPTHSEHQERYEYLRSLIQSRREVPFEPSRQFATEKYREAIKNYRSHFKTYTDGFSHSKAFLKANNLSVPLVRLFQEEITKKFKSFFFLLLEDIFKIVGYPPCGCDFQAMGSIGREEPCPFSDLELLVIIENDAYLSYFKILLQVLELAIKSIGENGRLSIVFTSIYHKNRSGFHLDPGGNPSIQKDLFAKPNFLDGTEEQVKKKRAALDKQIRDSKGAITPTYSSLKTFSIFAYAPHSKDPSFLIQTYREHTHLLLDEDPSEGKELKLRHAWALDLFKKRLTNPNKDPARPEEKGTGFREIWSCPPPLKQLNLKSHFVQLLNFLIADMALYWDISATNTLDIIDVLVEKKIFSERSGNLLKETVAMIYILRLRIHDLNNGQEEIIDGAEEKQLEMVYWLVLRPLYQSLSFVLESGKKLEDIFHQLDLLEIGFKEALSDKNSWIYKPFISHFVFYLEKIKISEEIHIHYYKRLIKIESLKLEYFKAIQLVGSQEIINKLAEQPSEDGSRISYLLHHQKIIEALKEISASTPFSEREITVKIEGPFLSSRYLNPDAIDLLLNDQGEIKKFYADSVHHVTPYGNLHFKQQPVQPLMEYAIYNLLFRIAGHLTPATELVRFTVTKGLTIKVYPVLISETIAGSTLKKGLPLEELGGEAWARWTWLLLSSILTKPGDGLPSNYILDSSQNIYCIDNDISFVVPFTKDYMLWKNINFCSALFCLFPNRPLDSGAIEQFCLLDIDVILSAWIDDVIEKEKEYLSLFSKEERKKLFDEKDPKKRCSLTLLFHEGALATLNLQFIRLQNFLLKNYKTNAITALDLLEQMIFLRDSKVEINVGQYVAESYKKGASLPVALSDKLSKATGRRGASLSLAEAHKVCLDKAPSIEEVETLKCWSPFEAKGELFAILLKRSSNFISLVSSGKNTIIRVNFKGITQEEGIILSEKRQLCILQALAYLSSEASEKPGILILQACGVLNSSLLEPFLHDKLEHLDLRFCPLITDADVKRIQERCPRLKALYLSGCSQLKILATGVFSNTPLEFSQLMHLEMEGCESLVAIQLKSPELKTLLASKNPLLKNVDIEVARVPYLEFHDSPHVIEKQVFMRMCKDVLEVVGSEIFDQLLPPSIWLSLVQTLRSKPSLQNPLFLMIELSKHYPAMAIAASNAISILNLAKVPLSFKDFRGIRIPGAYLRMADLLRTDLRDADLTGTNLANIVFASKTLFEGAKMERVNRGHLFIPCDVEVIKYLPILNETQLAGLCRNHIRIWDIETGKEKCYSWRGLGFENLFLTIEDGKKLILASESALLLWEIHSKEEPRQIAKLSINFYRHIVVDDLNKIIFSNHSNIIIFDYLTRNKVVIPSGDFTVLRKNKMIVLTESFGARVFSLETGAAFLEIQNLLKFMEEPIYLL